MATETDAEKKAINDYRAGRGNKITLHSADPGTTGANLIATTPASFTTTWGASAMGSGADTGRAVAAGSAGALQVPASTTATHEGRWNGATFLGGSPLDASITANANPVSVDVTPKLKYGNS
ncbi:hypothetical protein [Mycobacteroides franklinii]|uniref:hypothetical protein n=1 Tax=Mycobacteroides franklinii TaxID=948102 RepID=UPI000991EE0D|nr:hypothetical protein [Mycobacteroides franklinii]ORA64099.1 hypothetical protein BST24_02720 [Mycobacteroides franklinii]